MKFLWIVPALFIATACSSEPKAPASAAASAATRSCCSAGANCSTPDPKDMGGVCKADSAIGMEGLTQPITPDELAKLYTANKKQLGKTCSSAASAYCGKVSRDLNVTQDEVSCLWSKVFRVTRETLPRLDNTDCAKLLQKFAKK